MCDYALLLSRLEFSILLMAGGIKEIPCFGLSKAGDVDKKQMTKAIHGLIQKEFLQINEAGLCLPPKVAEMVEGMKTYKRYLLVEPGSDDQPQRAAYLGSKAVILENADQASFDFRLFLKARENCWTWLEEAFDMPSADIASKAEAEKLAGLSELAQRELEALRQLRHSDSGQGVRLWMEQAKSCLGNAAMAGMRLLDGSGQCLLWDVIVASGAMNLWFLRSNGDFLEVLPDSVETREKMKRYIGGE